MNITNSSPIISIGEISYKEVNSSPPSPIQNSREEKLQAIITQANTLPPSSPELSPRQLEILEENPMGEFHPLTAAEKTPNIFNPPKLTWSDSIRKKAEESPHNLICQGWEGKIVFNVPENLRYDGSVYIYFHNKSEKFYICVKENDPIKPLADLLCAITAQIGAEHSVPDEACELLTQAIKDYRKSIYNLSHDKESFNEIRQVLEFINAVYVDLYNVKLNEEASNIACQITMDEIIQLSHAIYDIFTEKYALSCHEINCRNALASLFYIYEIKFQHDLQNLNIHEIERMLLYTKDLESFPQLKNNRELAFKIINYYYRSDLKFSEIENYLNKIKVQIDSAAKKLKLIYEKANSKAGQEISISDFDFIDSSKDKKSNKEDCSIKISIDLAMCFSIALLQIAVKEKRDDVFKLYEYNKLFFENFKILKPVYMNSKSDFAILVDFINRNKKVIEDAGILIDELNLLKRNAIYDKLKMICGDELKLEICEEGLNFKFTTEHEAKLFTELTNEKYQDILDFENMKDVDSFFKDFENFKNLWIYRKNQSKWEKNLKAKYSEALSAAKVTFVLSPKLPRVDICTNGMNRQLRINLFKSLDPLVGKINEKATEFSVDLNPFKLELEEKNGGSLKVFDAILEFVNLQKKSQVNTSKTSSKKSSQQKRQVNSKAVNSNFSYPHIPSFSTEPRNPASIRKRERSQPSAGKIEASKAAGPAVEIPKERVNWSQVGRFYEENHPDSVHRLHNKNCPDTFYAYLDPSISGEKALVDKFGGLLPEARYKRRGAGIKLVKRSETKNRNIPIEYTHKLKIKGDARIYGREVEQVDVNGNKKILIVFDKLLEKTHFKKGL